MAWYGKEDTNQNLMFIEVGNTSMQGGIDPISIKNCNGISTQNYDTCVYGDY